MCYLEETYHALCGHWGDRFNYRPCGAAHAPVGASYGCSNSQISGPRQLKTLCKNCTRRQKQPSQATSTFGAVSTTHFHGRQHIRMQVYQPRSSIVHPQSTAFEPRRSVTQTCLEDDRIVLTFLLQTLGTLLALNGDSKGVS